MEKKERVEIFDILKGIMIIFIIVTHFQWRYPEDYLKYGFVYYIDMAVPVFMTITGYLTAMSFEKKKMDSIGSAITLQIVVPKLLRFTIPFLIAFLVELPFMVKEGYSLIKVLMAFFSGGVGPGAYYTLVMIQVVFLAPVIYFTIKKYDLRGLAYCFIFAALWETIGFCWELTDNPYSYISLRYVSMLAFGCYFAIGKTELNKGQWLFIFILGIVWQTALNYIPLSPPFMNNSWARVNYLSSLFVMPILYYLIKTFKNKSFKGQVLKRLGKASYNIFLVQMVFYAFGVGIVYQRISGTIPQLLTCIAICCIAGYIFYTIENKLTTKAISVVKKQLK